MKQPPRIAQKFHNSQRMIVPIVTLSILNPMNNFLPIIKEDQKITIFTDSTKSANICKWARFRAV